MAKQVTHGDEPNTFYNLRVLYKSGYTHDFEVESFKVHGPGDISFVPAKQHNRPLLFGAQHVESVWLIGQRRVPSTTALD